MGPHASTLYLYNKPPNIDKNKGRVNGHTKRARLDSTTPPPTAFYRPRPPIILFHPLLLARRDEVALLPGIVGPPARERLAARLLRKVLHPRLELGAEVADEALDGPGEGLAES